MALIPVSVEQIKADALFINEVALDIVRFQLLSGLEPIFPPSAAPRAHKTKAARKKRRKRMNGDHNP